MIKPKPYKLKCQKCGYNKIIKPQSDVLNITDIATLCPKCKTEMSVIELNLLDTILVNLKVK